MRSCGMTLALQQTGADWKIRIACVAGPLRRTFARNNENDRIDGKPLPKGSVHHASSRSARRHPMAGAVRTVGKRPRRRRGPGQNSAHRAAACRNRLRSGDGERNLFLGGDRRDHGAAADFRLSRAARQGHSAHGGCAPGDHRQRQDVHVQDQAGNRVRRRSRIQGEAARAYGRRLHLRDHAPR